MRFDLSLSLCLIGLSVSSASASPYVSPEVLDQLASGQSVDVTVDFDASAVNEQADALAAAAGRIYHGVEELAVKRLEFARIKANALAGLAGIELLEDYENLNTSFVQIQSEAALSELLARPEVMAVHALAAYELFTNETRAFVRQDDVENAGVDATGTTVAVLDTGTTPRPPGAEDWFGGCTMGAGQFGCRIVEPIFKAAANDNSADDDDGHGTNVSGIVARLAPGADLLVADVFLRDQNNNNVWDRPYVVNAVNWVLGQQSPQRNIVAMNLSLGIVPSYSVQHCPNEQLAQPLANAAAAGIQPVIASGNATFFNGTGFDGVAVPACVPAAASVGAVYDADYGSQSWGAPPIACSDSATAGDQVTCFSQTAPILSLLAPGTHVDAAGQLDFTGTSMAAPHVAAAWAVLRASMPDASNADVLATLQARGQAVNDHRVAGGRVVSRIDFFDGLDADQGVGDGVLFPQDNCTELINASQVDSDTDGFGNHCDGDFDQSGKAGLLDFAIFRACLGESVPSASMAGGDHDPTCAESDMDGGQAVGIIDFALFRFAFPNPPGPSGLPCADPVEPMPGCTTPASLAGNAAQLAGEGSGEAAALYEEEDAQGRFVFAADSSGAELTVHTDASGAATHVTDETGATVLDLAP